MKLHLLYPIMKRKKSKKELFSLYLFSVLLSLYWPFISQLTEKPLQTAVTIFSALSLVTVAVALYRASLSLFTAALFFVLLFFLYPVLRIQYHLIHVRFTGINDIVVLTAYFIIVLIFQRWRSRGVLF